MSDASAVDLSIQESCNEAMLHANVEVKLLIDKANELEADNVRLRELLADARRYISHPADASWTHMRRKEARDSLSDRMRELGVDE